MGEGHINVVGLVTPVRRGRVWSGVVIARDGAEGETVAGSTFRQRAIAHLSVWAHV